MSYSWQTPVTNRTSTNYYNFGDINRVDNNTRYLKDYIELFSNAITLENYTTQDVQDLPRPSLFNLIERNIEAIKDSLAEPIGWQNSVTDWTGGTNSTSFLYSDANRLEENLSLLKTMAENVESALLYCGTFNCGEGITAL